MEGFRRQPYMDGKNIALFHQRIKIYKVHIRIFFLHGTGQIWITGDYLCMIPAMKHFIQVLSRSSKAVQPKCKFPNIQRHQVSTFRPVSFANLTIIIYRVSE